MRLLWAYEHDFVAISPFLYERIDTLCRHPCWSLCEISERSEGYSKSLSARNAPTDLLLLTQRTSHLDPGPRASGTHFLKKEQFPFPPGSQVHGTTVCDTLLPHSCPRPILPVAKRVRFGDDIPPHAPLASSVWDPGSSVRMPQNVPLLPFAAPPQVCRLCHWSRLHSVWRRGSRCPACLAGSRAQFHSATRFSSPGDLPSSTAFSRRRWQSGTPLACARRLLSSWQRMQSSRSLQPR